LLIHFKAPQRCVLRLRLRLTNHLNTNRLLPTDIFAIALIVNEYGSQ